MSTAVPIGIAVRARPALRPLALPSEHGGWGFLFEPIALALLVAPSGGGALIAQAFIFAFLARQPLRLALQDALRGKAYPRTKWCRLFAAGYAAGAAASLAGAIAAAGWSTLLPLALAAPLGLVQVVYDAKNRSRVLLPELCGAVAMSSSAAAIAIAGGLSASTAFTLAGVIVARSIPSIVYVRALLRRAHGQSASSWPVLALHLAAVLAVAAIAPLPAAAAMLLLFARAAWQLARPAPPAKRIGWTEVVFGAITVGVSAAAWLA